jgi:transcriptional regulator with XRE-family HTH domain
MAAVLGVSAPTLCRIENGEVFPDGPTLMKIFNWLMAERK